MVFAFLLTTPLHVFCLRILQWGLLITFIELIKNPRYSFWRKSFTRCAPELERVFESVARSCIGPNVSALYPAGGPDADKSAARN
jgi:CCR4-Not complex component, Not1